jgi:hypothetical protein
VVAVALVLAGPEVEAGRSAGTASIRDLYTTLLAAAGIVDTTAESEGRRDLRSPSGARRLVGIERRRLGIRPREAVTAHAAAATDGDRLVIVAEDGAPTLAPADTATALLEAARSRLAGGAAPVEPPDAATREALRQLGYAE